MLLNKQEDLICLKLKNKKENVCQFSLYTVWYILIVVLCKSIANVQMKNKSKIFYFSFFLLDKCKRKCLLKMVAIDNLGSFAIKSDL